MPNLSDTSIGPAIRPLDFATLMQSSDAMHAELARTVDELAQWLNVVEVGFTQILDSAVEDTIEEEQEQEDSSSLPHINGVGLETQSLHEEVVHP